MEAGRDRTGSHIISRSLIVAAFFGFLLVVFLIVKSGAAEVASAMLVLGWRLAPITLYHLVPLSFDSLAWRELLPPSTRPGFLAALRIRWIRESINSLLPVAGVGGDIAGARLANKGGVPGAQAAASMVVDITVGAGTQLVFVLAGVALLATRSNADAASAVARASLIGVAVFAAAIAAFVLVQHNSMFELFARWRAASRRKIGCPPSPATPQRSTSAVMRHISPPLRPSSPARCASRDGPPAPARPGW